VRTWLLAVGPFLFAPKPNPAPELAAPTVTLEVAPAAGLWRITVRNDGETPARIAADARLLTLAVDGPDTKAKKKPVRCALPDDARPANDEGNELVVPGKRSWSASFDPLYHCFGARAAMVAGATVTPTFGWESRAKKPGPPFAVAPVGASAFAPQKALTGAAFTLSDAHAAAFAPPPEASTSGVSLVVPATMDAARGVELNTVVSLRNGGDRGATLLFRPELVTFAVSGPGGAVDCGRPKSVPSPIRELFTTIPPKGRSDMTVLLTAVCPAGTFDRAGVYRVTAKLDTREASGRPVGLATWDDVASSPSPMLLRVRSPRRPASTPKPTLD